MKILVLGANGFIGSTLIDRIVETTNWHVTGLDIHDDNLYKSLGHENFSFVKGDIFKNQEWIETQVKAADVVLPLVAIANPAIYVSDPLRVFELDFEKNLEVVRLCVKHKKRLIFPSTSEVYGMCEDSEFDEETSNLVLGPVSKQRWIYSCSKQMLDRVILAYGEHQNLDFTLFRPFNWIGPRLDRLSSDPKSTSRSLTLFISNILYHGEIKLVNGGNQRRCFTDIAEGIDCLMKIIENKDSTATGQIFNIGNPKNEYTIKDYVQKLLTAFEAYPEYANYAKSVKITSIDGEAHFGKSYQDPGFRVPAVQNAKEKLGWEPKSDVDEIFKATLDYYFKHKKVVPGNILSENNATTQEKVAG